MKSISNWILIPSTKNLYEVNEYGDVRNTRNGISIRSCISTKIGYKMVSICMGSGSKVQTRYVHDLVAEVFLGEKPPGKEVNHMDGNKINNEPSNLEYVTRSENIKHGLYNGLVLHGETRPDSKLTKEIVEEIRVLRKTTGYGAMRIAHLLGNKVSSVSAVGHVINNTSWNWDGKVLLKEVRKSIACHSKEVLLEQSRDVIMWGDSFLLDVIAERCTHTNLMSLHPLIRHQHILQQLGRSKHFKKYFITLPGIARGRVRCFKLLSGDQ